MTFEKTPTPKQPQTQVPQTSPSPAKLLGDKTIVYTADNSRAKTSVRYAVMDLENLIPSHNPNNAFNANPEYSPLINPNNYNFRSNNTDFKQELMFPRGGLNELVLLDTGNSSVNGSPIVDSKGRVLGGNYRTMLMQAKRGGRYSNYDESNYKTHLIENATDFGLDGAEVAKMGRPVLVRLTDESLELKADKSNLREVQELMARLNDDPRNPQTKIDKQAHSLDEYGDAVMNVLIQNEFEENETTKKYIARNEIKFVEALQAKGSKVTRYATSEGLTAEGKEMIENAISAMLLGQNTMAKLVSGHRQKELNKLFRSAGLLFQLHNTGYDLLPTMRQAYEHLAESLSFNGIINYLTQRENVGGAERVLPNKNDKSIQLLLKIKNMPGKEFRERISGYVEESKLAIENSGGFLGEAVKTPEQIFEEYILSKERKIK